MITRIACYKLYIYKILNNKKSMRKKLISIILLIGVILEMILMPYTVCQASSATITLSTDMTSVKIGDEVLVSIQLSSEASIGDFDAYISYDSDILEYQKEASFMEGSEGLIKISDLNVSNPEYSRKYIIKFIAKEVGNCDISLEKQPSIYDYDTDLTMSVSANKLSIQVSATETASTNANLKSLETSTGTLNPDFDPDITEYELNVTQEMEQLIIQAIAEDEASTVLIKGNDKLSAGSNKIVIEVKAESGHIKEYTIVAVYNPDEPTVETTDTEEVINNEDINSTEVDNENKSVQINDVTVTKNGEEIYIQNGYKYRILTIQDDNEIPDGYIKTTIILNDITIDAYTPENDLESDFLLLYAENENGDSGFYQYDRVEKTIQRFIGNNNESLNKLILSEDIIHSEDYKDKLTTMAIIIAILGAIIITMSIVLVQKYMKTHEL